MFKAGIEIADELRKALALPKIGQIGIVVRDIEKAKKLYTDLFDVDSWGETVIPEFIDRTFHGKPGNFRYKVALTSGVEPQWELIQPMEGETVFDEDLGENGEGLHHIGFHIDNLEARIDAAKQLGIEVTQSGHRPEVRSKWAYLGTKFLAGVTIELIHKPY